MGLFARDYMDSRNVLRFEMKGIGVNNLDIINLGCILYFTFLWDEADF